MDLVPKENGYVFINPETSELYTDIHKGFDKAVERAGIKDFIFHVLRHTVGTRLTPYSLRHTAATRMVQSGIDLTTVQDILGHTNLKVTQRYSHPVPKRKKQAIDALNSYYVNC